jgi:hypothetical protein
MPKVRCQPKRGTSFADMSRDRRSKATSEGLRPAAFGHERLEVALPVAPVLLPEHFVSEHTQLLMHWVDQAVAQFFNSVAKPEVHHLCR